MRWGLLIIAFCLPGCLASPEAQTSAHHPVAQIAGQDAAITASLAFEPPLVAAGPELSFPREGRAQTAYAGFDEIISTYYYLRVDDHQLDLNGHNLDRFERRAITTRVGVTHR